jgi:hypothetical protein
MVTVWVIASPIDQVMGNEAEEWIHDGEWEMVNSANAVLTIFHGRNPCHSPFTIHHSPFTIHHSPFTIHHSPFTA